MPHSRHTDSSRAPLWEGTRLARYEHQVQKAQGSYVGDTPELGSPSGLLVRDGLRRMAQATPRTYRDIRDIRWSPSRPCRSLSIAPPQRGSLAFALRPRDRQGRAEPASIGMPVRKQEKGEGREPPSARSAPEPRASMARSGPSPGRPPRRTLEQCYRNVRHASRKPSLASRTRMPIAGAGRDVSLPVGVPDTAIERSVREEGCTMGWTSMRDGCRTEVKAIEASQKQTPHDVFTPVDCARPLTLLSRPTITLRAFHTESVTPTLSRKSRRNDARFIMRRSTLDLRVGPARRLRSRKSTGAPVLSIAKRGRRRDI
ncbi:hypothetical protein FKP32DRAFT_1297733 [Trametes sanguinea]|nr:hypothetical protein FKP32DRAFT_1297733 [Trametes sanguinea]